MKTWRTVLFIVIVAALSLLITFASFFGAIELYAWSNPSASASSITQPSVPVSANGPYLKIGAMNYLAKTMFPISTPPTYTQLNFGAGTTQTVNADGSVLLTVPTGTSGVQGLAAGAFAASAVYALDCLGWTDGTGIYRCGIELYESGTGKVMIYEITSQTAGNVQYLDNPYSCWTASGANYASILGGTSRTLQLDPSQFWMRVTVSAGNYLFWLSGDGINWFLNDTVAVTTCFTVGANETGISIRNASGTTQYMTVLSHFQN